METSTAMGGAVVFTFAGLIFQAAHCMYKCTGNCVTGRQALDTSGRQPLDRQVNLLQVGKH